MTSHTAGFRHGIFSANKAAIVVKNLAALPTSPRLFKKKKLALGFFSRKLMGYREGDGGLAGTGHPAQPISERATRGLAPPIYLSKQLPSCFGQTLRLMSLMSGVEGSALHNWEFIKEQALLRSLSVFPRALL